MLRFFYQLSFIIGGLWLATLAYALPPAGDLVARDRRTTAKNRPPAAQEYRLTTTVVIDAGHGGLDRGGIPGQRVAEKTMTLDVAQRLRSVLEANGYRVVMTRNSDVFVPLPTRVAIANSYRDAVFVCIHFNSAKRVGANGIETYFYSRESLRLASAVHYHVASGAPSPNRGVRRRGYYVLRRTRIPAVLVECGFLTNPTDAQYALTSSYRQKLAEEIAGGIRGRYTVASTSGSIRVAAAETIPFQPFIDQTRVRDPDISHSKRSAKKTSRKKSAKSKKSSASSEAESEKKASAQRKTTTDDDEGAAEKKSTPKKTEG
jgi:N-acetylmuramoyl-L-alanine amidase